VFPRGLRNREVNAEASCWNHPAKRIRDLPERESSIQPI
jgi:hypothetical protein